MIFNIKKCNDANTFMNNAISANNSNVSIQNIALDIGSNIIKTGVFCFMIYRTSDYLMKKYFQNDKLKELGDNFTKMIISMTSSLKNDPDYTLIHERKLLEIEKLKLEICLLKRKISDPERN